MKVSLKNIIVPGIPLSVLLILGFIGLWFSAYVGERFSAAASQATALARNVETFVTPNSLFANIVCISFTMLNAFLLAQINNRFTIIRTRTFLPVFVFLMLMSSWNETHAVITSHIILTLLIFALFYFFSMVRDRKASEQAFMGSLLVSVCSLFVNPLILLIPFCWIGFIIFQSFSLRTFLASVFGTLAPWILFLTAEYMITQSFDFRPLLSANPNLDMNILSLPLSAMIYTGGMIAIITVSILGMISLSSGDAIQTRNKLYFILLLLNVTVVVAFIFRSQFSMFLPLIALLFSLIFSHPFTLRQNNFHGIMFLIFVVFNIAFIVSKYFSL